MFITNLTFLGPLASGKTCLLRNLQGKPFRLTEPHTLSISFSENYLSLVEHLDWLVSSCALTYEDELVRIIIDELLKHAKTLVPGRRAASGIGMGFDGMGLGHEDTPPPLPPVLSRRRSQSFTDRLTPPRYPELEATKKAHRLSGSFEVLESGTPEGKLQMGYRGGLDTTEGHKDHLHGDSHHGTRKNIISRLFSTKSKGKTNLRRHHSDSTHRAHYTGIQANTNGNVATQATPRISSIPERLVEKIRAGMTDCTDSSVPVRYFGRLIDVPGAKPFQTIRSLFITDYSVCILVYDTSKNLDSIVSPSVRRKSSTASLKSASNGLDSITAETYFDQVMADFNNLGLHWSHSDADMTLRGQRVILVATHSDKVPSSVSHSNFDQLRTAIKASPYHKYVAMMKYVLSSSSVIERANMDDLKRFVLETVKKSCRQHVPLKWLRCLRRFLGLSEKGIYFITLEDAHKIVAETCDISAKEEGDAVIRFLHNNHVILHFSRIHQLCKVVFTNPAWFAQHLSSIFGAAWIEIPTNGPSRLQTDQTQLQTRGVFSTQLLDHVWREHGACREKLLAILHKMDLICCLGPNSQPIAPSTSPSNIAQDVDQHQSHTKPTDHLPSFTISSLVVPSIVTESIPPHLLRMPAFDLDPLHFRFKDGFVPYDVFPRLVARCIHSYPSHYTLYCNAAVFEVDTKTVLLISEGKGRITLNLYHGRYSASGSPEGLAPTNLDEVANHLEPPNLDTCMAVQMFLQAAISDIIQQWLPQVDYDMCVECKCSKPAPEGQKEGVHHVVLSQTDNILQRVSLDCERGSQVTIGVPLYSWFGEIPHPHSPEEDAAGEGQCPALISHILTYTQCKGSLLSCGLYVLELYMNNVSARPSY